MQLIQNDIWVLVLTVFPSFSFKMLFWLKVHNQNEIGDDNNHLQKVE